ncbi:MAG TPA: LytTR family DNA-binding domain-containing protein [Roseovarius sp.]|nr:LytTR family DNA-binding domain-containing protein [Roseovarius sp.]
MIWSEFRRHVTDAAIAFTSRVTISIWLIGCLVAVVAGPFGTFQTMDFGLRLAYWGTVITSGLVLGALANAVFLTICRGWHPLWIDLKTSVLITTLLAPLIFVLRAGLDPILTCADLSLGSIWINTGLFVLPIFFLRRQLIGTDKPPDPPRPRLMRRLPGPLQEAGVLRLSARDHTVEVATDHGTSTLRLRLKDAIDEMEPVEGLCTHRSHWVARAAVTGHIAEGGKLYLTLANGDRVPVSRKYRPRLEELGLVPGQDG